MTNLRSNLSNERFSSGWSHVGEPRVCQDGAALDVPPRRFVIDTTTPPPRNAHPASRSAPSRPTADSSAEQPPAMHIDMTPAHGQGTPHESVREQRTSSTTTTNESLGQRARNAIGRPSDPSEPPRAQSTGRRRARTRPFRLAQGAHWGRIGTPSRRPRRHPTQAANAPIGPQRGNADDQLHRALMWKHERHVMRSGLPHDVALLGGEENTTRTRAGTGGAHPQQFERADPHPNEIARAHWRTHSRLRR